MCCKNNTDENPGYLENLGYTYDDWQEIYTKEMSSGLSVGYISDWGGWSYYLEIERLVLGDEGIAALNADLKELKNDFNAFINYLKEVNGEVHLKTAVPINGPIDFSKIL